MDQQQSPKLSSEQQEISNTLRNFLEDNYSTVYVRGRVASGKARDQQMCDRLVELGLFEMFGEGYGGLIELALIARECGRALVVEPLVDSLLLNSILQRWGDGILAGPVDSASWIQLAPIASTFTAAGQCSGAPLALGAATELGLVWQRRGAPVLGRFTTNGPQLQVKQRGQALDFGREFIELAFDQSGGEELRPAVFSKLVATEALLRSSEMEGAARKAFELTLDYAKTRKQFGRPIGSNQAVQHGLARCYSQLEGARSLVQFSAWAGDNSAAQFESVAKNALIFSCENLGEVVESCIQFSGGVGFTWEYDLHLYLRRVRSLIATYRPRPDY